MIDTIRQFLAKSSTEPVAPQSAVPADSPARQLPGVHVAAAALLLELAHADGEFSLEEQLHIHAALGRHFGLEHTTAVALLALADEERRNSVDHFQFTRVVREQFDLAQRMVLAEVMWGVILADGEIASHEAYLVRKMASLLELEPAFLSQARNAAAAASSGG